MLLELPNNKEEKLMDLYHYLAEMKEEGEEGSERAYYEQLVLETLDEVMPYLKVK